MSKKDDEIQRKLAELESAVLKESTTNSQQQHVSASQPMSELLAMQKTTKKELPSTGTIVQNDLQYFGGIALMLTGVVMFMNHVHVGTGIMGAFGLGGGGFGLLFVPLMVGIGWLIYDSKSKIPWIVCAMSCGLLIFATLSSLQMIFPNLTFLGMVFMLLPFAAGGALMLKGMGGPKAIEQKFKKSSDGSK